MSMSRYKNILILISLFVLLVIGIIVFVFVLKSKNKSKKKEELVIIPEFSISKFKRGINLDNGTSVTNPTDWLVNWPLTTQTIKYVRTYSVSPSWVKWLEYLTDNGVYVFIGINSVGEVDALIQLLKKWKNSYPNRLPYIIGLSVANEPKGSEVQRVKDTANKLRQQLTANNLDLKEVPITACFVYDPDWIDFHANKLKHPEFYKSSSGPLDDVICFNIYGNLFSGTNGPSSPDKLTNSLDWSKGCQIPNQINTIRNAMKGSNLPASSQLWITEVGWTSEPLSKDAKGPGWASLENEKRFYNNFLTANSDIGADWPEYIFWFTVRDTRTSTKNESFGLLDSNGKQKFSGNPLPLCGSSCDTSCKCPDGTVCFNKSCVSPSLPLCGSSCDTSCKCPDGTVCDNNFSICAPSDCSTSTISCPKGYQCNQKTKSCIPIPPPSDDCYEEGENPFGLGCAKPVCCPGTTLRLHPKDSTSNQPYYICSSNTSYPSNIPPKCDTKTSPICLQSSFCKLPTCVSSCNPSCKCPDGTFCDSGSGICRNISSDCYENDEDVFGDKCKKGVKCCDNSTFCRNKNTIGNYKYYCHKGNTCIPGDSKVDPGSSIFPPCPTGNCNVPDSKLCKPK